MHTLRRTTAQIHYLRRIRERQRSMRRTIGMSTDVADTSIHQTGAKIEEVNTAQSWNPSEMRHLYPLRMGAIRANRTHIQVIMTFVGKLHSSIGGIDRSDWRKLILRLVIAAHLILGSATRPREQFHTVIISKAGRSRCTAFPLKQFDIIHAGCWRVGSTSRADPYKYQATRDRHSRSGRKYKVEALPSSRTIQGRSQFYAIL